MMGKVLVRKSQDVRKNQDAANLVSSLIGSGPKTNLGAALGGFGGGLSFLTILASAGEQQHDAVSGLGSAGLAAYGGYRGGASLGDGLMDAGRTMGVLPLTEEQQQAKEQARLQDARKEAEAAFDAAVPTTGSRIDTGGPIDPSTGLPSNIEINPVTNLAPAEHYQTQMTEQAKRAEERTDPSGLAFDPDFGTEQLGRIQTYGRFAPDIFSQNYANQALATGPFAPAPANNAYSRAIENIPPPQGGETDMPSIIDNSMGGNEDGGPKSAVTEVNPEAVGRLSDEQREIEAIVQGFENKKGEPMELAFLLLKAVVL